MNAPALSVTVEPLLGPAAVTTTPAELPAPASCATPRIDPVAGVSVAGSSVVSSPGSTARAGVEAVTRSPRS